MDNNKHNGLRTAAWGPPGWMFLHCITFGYPVNPREFDRKNGLRSGTTEKRYIKFFKALGDVLPCKHCRNNYKKNIKQRPIEKNVKSRDDITRWLYGIHNMVNRHLGYKYSVKFSTVKQKYEKYRAKCKPDTKKEEKIKNNKIGCVIPVGNKKYKCKVVTLVDSKKRIKRRIRRTRKRSRRSRR